MKKLKVAVVHDDFIQKGGAEFLVLDLLKELKKINEIELVVFTSIINNYWKQKFLEEKLKFESSFLGRIPFSDKLYKVFFLSDLFYLAFESFDFSNYDIVFSSSTRFGHSVITKPSTLHISYINSPSKMLWEVDKYFFGKKFLYSMIKNFLPKKRVQDFVTQQRSDLIISNSRNILKKIHKIYHRDSIILHPFINLKSSSNFVKKDFFIVISRIIPWKRIEYVVEAFNLSRENLLIVGQGDEVYLEKLKSIANSNINFLGFVTNEEKYNLLGQAKALIVPQDEDFGLTIVEALNMGTPIIYYNKGGAQEILSKEFGEPFEFQEKNSLVQAINSFKSKTYSVENLKHYALKFSSENFIKELIKIFSSKM